jgi:hypothetical protein
MGEHAAVMNTGAAAGFNNLGFIFGRSGSSSLSIGDKPFTQMRKGGNAACNGGSL